MTTIVRMLRFGPRFSVQLECGHKLDVTRDEAKRRQLSIGKRVICEERQGR